MKFTPRRAGIVLGIGVATLGIGVGATSLAGAASSEPSHEQHASEHHASSKHAGWTEGAGHKAEVVRAIAETGTLPTKFTCDTASTWQSKLSTAESKIDGVVPMLQSKQATASSAGDVLKAQILTDRINDLQSLRADLVTVSGLITTKCG
jgi:hypothetical protein